ncbi:MAG: type II 3-dehydroquinate dehydratase [Bacteroidales bacterium]|nr:type II 3-dehydroquinate dehydratase [Bacteroidales bacterium]
MNLLIINGPNLNLLGTREKSIYGELSFEEYFMQLKKMFPNVEFEYYQSNIEGEIIDKLQQRGFSVDGIILNAGAYTHTSIAIADAIRSIPAHVIETHISNVHKREEYRHHSMIASACKGVIAGFGLDSYRLAIQSFILPC